MNDLPRKPRNEESLWNSTWNTIQPWQEMDQLSSRRWRGHSATGRGWAIGAHAPWPTESYDPYAALSAAIDRADPDGYHSHKRKR